MKKLATSSVIMISFFCAVIGTHGASAHGPCDSHIADVSAGSNSHIIDAGPVTACSTGDCLTEKQSFLRRHAGKIACATLVIGGAVAAYYYIPAVTTCVDGWYHSWFGTAVPAQPVASAGATAVPAARPEFIPVDESVTGPAPLTGVDAVVDQIRQQQIAWHKLSLDEKVAAIRAQALVDQAALAAKIKVAATQIPSELQSPGEQFMLNMQNEQELRAIISSSEHKIKLMLQRAAAYAAQAARKSVQRG